MIKVVSKDLDITVKVECFAKAFNLMSKGDYIPDSNGDVLFICLGNEKIFNVDRCCFMGWDVDTLTSWCRLVKGSKH